MAKDLDNGRVIGPATMPEHPTGFDKRMISTEPREASDASALEERIYRANLKAQTPSLYPDPTPCPIEDGNGSMVTDVYKRVAAVKKVLNTTGHTIGDYPGESQYFLKETIWSGDAYMTLTIGGDHKVRFHAPEKGSYTGTLQISQDALTWEYVELEKDYTTAVNVTSLLDEMNHPLTRQSTQDDPEDTSAYPEGATHLYAWYWSAENCYRFTTSPSPVAGDILYYYWVDTQGEPGRWLYDYEVASTTGDYGNKLYIRGRLAKGKGDNCPRLGISGTPNTTITKVEGSLQSLLDATGTVYAPNASSQFTYVFSYCTALTDVSGVTFPTGITKGKSYAYAYLFAYDTALTAPASLANVPMETSTQGTLDGVYMGCTSLTAAPALPKLDIVPSWGFYNLFNGCTSLATVGTSDNPVYIGTQINNDGTLNWLKNVAASGTFYHSENTFRWPFEVAYGIPSGWTPSPELTTKLYFSSLDEEKGVVSAYNNTSSKSIYNGESVTRNNNVTITASAKAGYVFDHWDVNTTGGTPSGATITFNMPYGRWEDAADKKQAVAHFRRNANLAVNYPYASTVTELAFVRYPSLDSTRGTTKMFAWVIGTTSQWATIYTETLDVVATSSLYTLSGSEWAKSSASVASSVWTNKVSVVILNDATTVAQSSGVAVTADGYTYHNDYQTFCGCIATSGSSVSITVTGSYWKWNDDSSTTSPRTITVGQYGSYLRIVNVASHTLTFTAGEHGTVTATVDSAAVTSPCSVFEGASVVLTAAANEGYVFSAWSGTHTGSTATLTFTMPASDVTDTAAFVAGTFALNFSAGEGGSVTATAGGQSVASGASVAYGTEVIITADASSGYQLDSFEGQPGSAVVSGNTCTFNMIAEAVTVRATFKSV